MKQTEHIEYFNNGSIKSRLEPLTTSPNLFMYYEYYKSGEIYFKAPIANSRWEGVVEYYYKNGKIKERLTYSNNYPNGECIKYYEDGNTHKIFYQKDGYTIGDYSIFHSNGWLKEKGTILQPKINPGDIQKIEFTMYYENGNTKYTAQKWGDDIADEARKYWPEGKLESVYNYLNGKAIGEYTLYHKDGWLSESGNITYTNSGLEQFDYKLLDKSGVITHDGRTVDGNKDGEIREYWPKGNLESVYNYLNGKALGEYSLYHKDGWLSESGNITYTNSGLEQFDYKLLDKSGVITHDGRTVDGNKDGEIRQYWPNGKVRFINHYEYGLRLMNFKEFNRKGLLIREGLCLDPECVSGLFGKEYDQKGRLKSKYQVLDGMIQGWYDIYQSGNLVASVYYVDDVKDGRYKEYYPNGNIKESGSRIDGMLEGKLIRYYENGQIKMKAKFKRNKMNGYRQSYSKYGEELQTVYYENGIMTPY